MGPRLRGDDRLRQVEGDHPSHTPALRWMADMLCLSGLCGRPACRRARLCKCEPRECLARYAPLTPEDAREGVQALMEGLRLGLSYDAVRDEVKALEAWRELVEESRRNDEEPRRAPAVARG